MNILPYLSRYWQIETERTDEERWSFDEGDVWPEKPPCPVCDRDIDRAYKKNALVREIESHAEVIEIEPDEPVMPTDSFTITEKQMNIGIVEPCEHKFQNPSVLHDYVMGHKFGMGSIRGRSTAANELVENRLW